MNSGNDVFPILSVSDPHKPYMLRGSFNGQNPHAVALYVKMLDRGVVGAEIKYPLERLKPGEIMYTPKRLGLQLQDAVRNARKDPLFSGWSLRMKAGKFFAWVSREL